AASKVDIAIVKFDVVYPFKEHDLEGHGRGPIPTAVRVPHIRPLHDQLAVRRRAHHRIKNILDAPLNGIQVSPKREDEGAASGAELAGREGLMDRREPTNQRPFAWPQDP